MRCDVQSRVLSERDGVRRIGCLGPNGDRLERSPEPAHLVAPTRQSADGLVVGVAAVKSSRRRLFSALGVDALPQNQKRASLALRALRTGVVSRRDL